MVAVARLIGGAGTGKTTELMRIIEQVAGKGVDPYSIGFCSFTRAARLEASTRAADMFGIRQPELERFGWFKTLHSICYRQLGVGSELLASGKKTSEWFEEHFGERVDVEADDDVMSFTGKSRTGQVLALWSSCRNRLEPFEDSWERSVRCSIDVPDLEECREVVSRYEMLKAIDGVVDFVDILGKFAGWAFGFDGHNKCEPDGEVPDVPVWVFDEQQDTSQLLDSVCRRLVYSGSTSWCYLAGDPFQSIYGFSGADGSLFRNWDADHERITGKSWRCSPEILELGERCIENCADYFDRGIEPAAHDGSVGTTQAQTMSWLTGLAPDDDVLLLARTNRLASWFAKKLNAVGLPWESTKGTGSWLAPSKRIALRCLQALASGEVVDWLEFLEVVKQVNAKGNFTRGTKTKWIKGDKPAAPMVKLDGLTDWGATDELVSKIKAGRWSQLIDGGAIYEQACSRFDVMSVLKPTIKVGTIHSVKGAEADEVVLLTSSTKQISNSEKYAGGLDEERRLAYVGVTRARKKLTLLNDLNARSRMPLPW